MADGRGTGMKERLMQVGIGVAASILTLLIVAIWGELSDGKLIRILGGVTQAELAAAQAEVDETRSDVKAAEGGLAAAWDRLGATRSEVRTAWDGLGATRADVKAMRAGLDATRAELAAARRTLLPEGVVVAFDGPDGCPEGWSALSDAVGKAIIGAGGGDAYPYRASGGKEHIDLTERHIPAHAHAYADAYFSESDNRRPRGTIGVEVPEQKGHDGAVDKDNVGWAVTRTTGEFGYKDANRIRHTNMQPYIALHFCVFKPS